MKTVEEAFFDPAGQMVVVITRGRFHGYAIEDVEGELVATKLWDHNLKNVLWIAFAANAVIASNTSDQQVAVAKKSGQVLWERPRPKRDGITGRGIVVGSGDEERYVFTGHEFVYQVSTETGQDVEPGWPIPLWTQQLHQRDDGRIGAIVPVYFKVERQTPAVAAIDLSAQTLELLGDLPAGLTDPLPAPQGNRLVANSRPDPESRSLEVLDLPSMERVSTRLLGDGQTYLYPATWSPCGNWIGLGTTFGYLLLSSELDQAIEVPYGRARGLPAFHPNGEHVLLPRQSTTCIERIDALAATYG